MTTRRPKMFFFFLDGVGLSTLEPNPIKDLFSPLISDEKTCLIKGIDAVMGVKGMPQSATGQTSLFTGINAQEYLGYHLNAFPNSKLLPLFREKSIMKILNDRGVKVTSANLYSHQYFESRRNKRRNAFSASTLTIEASGVPFRMHGDGQTAVFADLTGELLYSRGIEYPPISAQEAAIKMADIISGNDFTMFEYFMTDYYGHKKDGAALQVEVKKINLFLSALIPLLDPDCAFLAVSDHGNAEDMTTADHTMNPALFLFSSRQVEQYRESLMAVEKLTDVYDFILKFFSNPIL